MPQIMFSIVIPLYNKEHNIKSTIDSVLSQSFSQFEIIVVDDGSSDNSIAVINSIEDERIRIISKKNGGVSSARNVGIYSSRYEYIAFLDADDLWDENYLLEQKKMIEDFPDAVMWGINFAPVLNGMEYTHYSTALPEGFRGIVKNYFQMTGRVSDLFCSSSVVIKKDILHNCGLFDERIRYAEDLDMWYRIIARHPVAFYDKVMVFYQHDAENRALSHRIPLVTYLPYFVDKFVTYKDNFTFYKFINNWSAIKIKQYYRNRSTRQIAIEAAQKLDFSVLPKKYKKIYCNSYFKGLLNYWIYETLHNLKNKIINA